MAPCSCVPNVAQPAMPLPAEAREGSSPPLASWVTPAHASLMATTTTDDFLAVFNDEESLRSAEH